MTESAKTILVLDDDHEILELVRRVLEREGYAVVTTHDPREALSLIAEREPCLIVADLMLPHMDGEDFLRNLERQSADHPPVVIVSASAAREEIAARTSAKAVLAKPFQIEDLTDLVARFAS